MSKLSITAYTFGIICFIICCSMAIFYGFKFLSNDVTLEEESMEDYKYHFVLVPEELDNDYWRLVEAGAQKAAKEHNVLLEYIGPEQADNDIHIKMLEKVAAAKVDGIFTQGLNNEQFTPLINQIVEKIPVITVDTDASSSNRVAYIGTDNYYAGYLAGKALIEDTKGKANVAIIAGNLEANHQQQRVDGFKEAVKDEQGIEIIAIEESKISRVRAAEKAYLILKEHPEVNAFYGTSALDGIGIARMIEKYDQPSRIYVIGFDTLPETIDYMRKGTIEATVAQEPEEMGYKSIKMMINLIEGKYVPSIVHTNTSILRVNDVPLNDEKGDK